MSEKENSPDFTGTIPSGKLHTYKYHIKYYITVKLSEYKFTVSRSWTHPNEKKDVSGIACAWNQL